MHCTTLYCAGLYRSRHREFKLLWSCLHRCGHICWDGDQDYWSTTYHTDRSNKVDSRAVTREESILSLAPKVDYVIRRLFQRVPSYVNREDMYSEAWVGAIKAVDRFNPRLHVPLTAFAQFIIWGHVVDYLRQLDPLGRTWRDRVKSSNDGVTVTMIEMSQWIPDHRPLADFRQVENSKHVSSLMYLACLKPNYRFVLHKIYWDQASSVSVAKELRVDGTRVSAIHKLAIKKLREAALA